MFFFCHISVVPNKAFDWLYYSNTFVLNFTILLFEHLKDFRAILTIEDGALKGGLFSEVSEYVSSHGMDAIVKGIGVPDRFIPHASAAEQRRSFGLDGEGIYSQLLRLYKNN